MSGYRVYTRTWWKKNPQWPDGLEPHMGRKTTLAVVSTYKEAQDMCTEWNANHAPGRLSRKAEFEKD